jgi:flagellar protein FliO/FliZ
MSHTSDIWIAFARTFSMLFVVLALLILSFYLIKRFSEKNGGGKNKGHIHILSVHHLSPKEKLILVNVAGENLFIGVTPNHISKISRIEKEISLSDENTAQAFHFSELLSQKLGRPFKKNEQTVSVKEQFR